MENERAKEKKTGVEEFYVGSDVTTHLMLCGYRNPVLYADPRSANFTWSRKAPFVPYINIPARSTFHLGILV